MNILIAGEKSNICLEGCRFPATDSLITFQHLNSYRLEGTEIMVKNKRGLKTKILWQNEDYRRMQSGAHKGNLSPMKGKKLSEGHKKKLSDSHKGGIPWNKGIKLSEEHRLKCIKAGFKKGEHRSPVTEFKKGLIPHNKSTKGLIKSNRGSFKKGTLKEMHPRWIDGRSFEPYCHKFNKILKERIRERDNRTCQLCGEKENGRKLACHHIHYDKENCEPDLISLCLKCNSKVNANREYYEDFFMRKLTDKTA